MTVLRAISIGVVTETRGQFENYINDLVSALHGNCKIKYNHSKSEVSIDGQKYFFVSTAKQLRGLRNYILVFGGTFFDRKDIAEIKEIDRPNQWASGRRPSYDD